MHTLKTLLFFWKQPQPPTVCYSSSKSLQRQDFVWHWFDLALQLMQSSTKEDAQMVRQPCSVENGSFLVQKKIIPTSNHLVAIEKARWGEPGWPRLPGPALHWSKIPLMDICHSPTTEDPGLNEICMEQGCLAATSQHESMIPSIQNAFIIYCFLSKQPNLCILIPRPVYMKTRESWNCV